MNLRISWAAQADATRKFWRIYLSDRETYKGELIAEVGKNDRSFLIRNVSEGPAYVRVIAVNRNGVETPWADRTSSAGKVTTRRENEPTQPANSVATQIEASSAVSVVLDAQDSGDKSGKVEVIRGNDPDLGQLVGTFPVSREDYTGDGGERQTTPPIVMSPGRLSTTTFTLRGVSDEGRTSGAATTFHVSSLPLANYSATVVASVVTSNLSGLVAPTSTMRWEAGTYGVRLRANPASEDWGDGVSGWGTSGTGILASEPSGAYWMTGATITFTTYDLGSPKDIALECYDEAQRVAGQNVMATVESRRLIAPSNLVETDEDRTVIGPNHLFTSFRSGGKPWRPLPPTRWQVFGDDVGWRWYVPGMRLRTRQVNARMYLREPTGQSQVVVPRAYVRVWEEHAKAPITLPPHGDVLQPIGYGGLKLGEGSTPFNVSTSVSTVTGYSAAMSTYHVTASVSGGTLIPRYGGIYSVNFDASFSGAPNVDMECYLYIDGAKQTEVEFHRAMGASGDIGSAGFNTLIALSTNAVVKVGVICSADSKTWTPEALGFQISRER